MEDTIQILQKTVYSEHQKINYNKTSQSRNLMWDIMTESTYLLKNVVESKKEKEAKTRTTSLKVLQP